MSLTLEEQVRLESGFGLEWSLVHELATNNGSPNAAPDPYAQDAGGWSCVGKIHAVYQVAPVGGTAEYRLWVAWRNAPGGQPEWSLVEDSERTAPDSTPQTQRVRIAGAVGYYIEWTGGTATSVFVNGATVSGIYTTP